MVYTFMQMVTKQKFGFCANEKGEKALHTLKHVMLNIVGADYLFFAVFWDYVVIKEWNSVRNVKTVLKKVELCSV